MSDGYGLVADSMSGEAYPLSRDQRMPLRHNRVLTRVLHAASTGPLPMGRPRRRKSAHVILLLLRWKKVRWLAKAWRLLLDRLRVFS